MSRRFVLTVLAIVAPALLLCCGGLTLIGLLTAINDEGSPELAQEWKLALESFADFNDAERKDANVQGKRFPNGDWIFGLCRDSHGLLHRGGGTIVVRDSRGAVRAFFGHVCGPRFLHGPIDQSDSLEGFYKQLEDAGYREYRLNPTNN